MLKSAATLAVGAAPTQGVRGICECRRELRFLRHLRCGALPRLPSFRSLKRPEFPPLVGIGIFRRIQTHRSIRVPSVLQVDDQQQVDESQCFSGEGAESVQSDDVVETVENSFPQTPDVKRIAKGLSKRQTERRAYLFAAIASTTGFTTLAVAAVFYRFLWQMQGSGEIPYTEIFGTFALAVGAAVGMEYWARWAHKALWHASLWNMHESHHRPRDGPFELNDIFAIINAVPAISLMLYGFLNQGFLPGLCFGAGLGITMFGIAYMFVHDGLVHRRFPVGPIADVPYFQQVAAAHQLHHADLYEGVPYGLFLGPKELEEVGGLEELEKVMKQRAKTTTASK